MPALTPAVRRVAHTDVQRRCRRGFWALLAVMTLVRLVLAGRVGLGVDEAHDLMLARHLAWGYFDHPPMVAFLGAATTLAGDGPFFVRLGPIVCTVLVLVLLRRLALDLFRDERVALLASVVLLAMPMHHLVSAALLPDATLNVFWAATLVAVWRATHRGRWRDWILAGLLCGGALLSKYHGALLPVCVLLYLLQARTARQWLLRPQPFAAVVVSLVVFCPNVAWNARHDWISYTYQLRHGLGGGDPFWSTASAALGGQMVAASPIVLGLLILAFALVLFDPQASDAERFLLSTSLPVGVLFGVAFFTGRVLPHWPYVAWLSGSLLVASVVLRRTAPARPEASARRWRRWATAGLTTGLLLVLVTYLAIFTPLVERVWSAAAASSRVLYAISTAVPTLEPPDASMDITNDMYGWETIAAAVERAKAAMPRPGRTFVFCHRYFIASSLAVHLDRSTFVAVLSFPPNQYRVWFDAADHAGWDALFVDDDRQRQKPSRYEPLFEKVDPASMTIEVQRAARVVHVMRVFRCYAFRGRFEERRR